MEGAGETAVVENHLSEFLTADEIAQIPNECVSRVNESLKSLIDGKSESSELLERKSVELGK